MLVYFGKMITKQGNKPEIDSLWRHHNVILRFSNSLQRPKAILYLR